MSAIQREAKHTELQERLHKLYNAEASADDPKERERLKRQIERAEQRRNNLDHRFEEPLFSEEAINAILSERGDMWTPAEIEDEKRVKAGRAEAKRQREAAIKRNPHLAFKNIFKGQSAYFNGPVRLLAALPFQHSAFSPNTTERRKQQQAAREQFRAFFRAYAIVYVARDLYRQQQKVDIMKLRQPSRLPKGYDPANQRHLAIGAAMDFAGREGGSIERLKHYWKLGRKFLKQHGINDDDKANRDLPRVQISLALLSEEHSYLSERDLRVLMAVNSCCGEKGWHKINWQMIAVRAVGAENKRQVKEFGVNPLSRKQVGCALEQLQKRGLIRRVLLNNRITFVAKGQMPQETLEDIALGWDKREKRSGKAVRLTATKANDEAEW